MKTHLCPGKTCKTHPERVLRDDASAYRSGGGGGGELNQAEGMASALSSGGWENLGSYVEKVTPDEARLRTSRCR